MLAELDEDGTKFGSFYTGAQGKREPDSDLTRSLDDDEKGTHIMRTPSGDQEMSIVSEAGLYRGILPGHAASSTSGER